MEVLKSIYSEVSAYREQLPKEGTALRTIYEHRNEPIAHKAIARIIDGRLDDLKAELTVFIQGLATFAALIREKTPYTLAEMQGGDHKRAAAVYAAIQRPQRLSEKTKEICFQYPEIWNDELANATLALKLFSICEDFQSIDIDKEGFFSFLAEHETELKDTAQAEQAAGIAPVDAQSPEKKETIVCDTVQWNESKKEFAILANEAFAKAEKKKRKAHKDKKDFVFIFFAKFSFPKFPTWTAQQCYEYIAQLSK